MSYGCSAAQGWLQGLAWPEDPWSAQSPSGRSIPDTALPSTGGRNGTNRPKATSTPIYNWDQPITGLVRDASSGWWAEWKELPSLLLPSAGKHGRVIRPNTPWREYLCCINPRATPCRACLTNLQEPSQEVGGMGNPFQKSVMN